MDRDEAERNGTIFVTPKAYTLPEGGERLSFAHIYTEYSRFHSDEANIVIHCIFVPLIMFSMCGLFQHFQCMNILKLDFSGEAALPTISFGSFKPIRDNSDVFVINVIMLQWAVCGVVYLMVDIIAGTLCFSMGLLLNCLACWVNAQEEVA